LQKRKRNLRGGAQSRREGQKRGQLRLLLGGGRKCCLSQKVLHGTRGPCQWGRAPGERKKKKKKRRGGNARDPLALQKRPFRATTDQKGKEGPFARRGIPQKSAIELVPGAEGKKPGTGRKWMRKRGRRTRKCKKGKKEDAALKGVKAEQSLARLEEKGN